MKNITVGILAGGRSLRMGTDKALLRVNEETFLERTIRIVSHTGLPSIVIGRNRPEGFGFSEVPFLQDEYPGIGPLGGLITGLRYTESRLALLPCDMPLLTGEAMGWLINTIEEHSADITLHGLISRSNKRIEPLFSLYAPHSLALAEKQYRSGNFSMHGFIDAGNFIFVDIPEGLQTAIHNVNRPEDFRRTK